MLERTVSVARQKVTVAICTRDRPGELAECLASLGSEPGIEVLVVDNAPSDDAAKRVSELAGARYVVEPIAGLSRARNLAWRRARGSIVAYLDDDARPEAGWLEALVRPFGDPSVMVVTGRILPPHFHWAGSEAFRLDMHAVDWRGRSLFGGAGGGSNMAFRRSFLERSGGFDETIGRGRILNIGEEHEAFYRVLARGFVLAYEPDAIVHHPYDDSRNADLRAGVAFAIHLFVKHAALRGWLFRRVLRSAAGKRNPHRPGAQRRSLFSRIRAGAGGGVVFLLSRLAGNRPVAHQSEQRD